MKIFISLKANKVCKIAVPLAPVFPIIEHLYFHFNYPLWGLRDYYVYFLVMLLIQADIL